MPSRSRSRNSSARGFTLLEAMVAVGLAAVLITVYAMTVTGAVFLRRSASDMQAANFVREEIDALRSLPYAELLDRTDGPFLGTVSDRGTWNVTATAGSPSSPNALALSAAATPAAYEETGLMAFPGNWRTDFTADASVNVSASSPAGWGAGIAFRYRDAENHYRFRMSSAGMALDKVYHGTKTTLWSQSISTSAGTWYSLEVVAAGTSITLKRNGATLATVTDAAFTGGEVALFGANGALASFDGAAVSGSGGADGSWNFDGYAAGALPTDWQRLSPTDLPGGSGTVTIAPYLGQAAAKQATVKVNWSESGRTRTATGSTIISQ